MTYNFKECVRDQIFLLLPRVRVWLPEKDLAWFIIDAVEQMDLKEFYGRYRPDRRGQAAFEPSMMVALLLYSYCMGSKIIPPDGAAVREKLNKHLKFSPQHIMENNRTIAQLCLDGIYSYDYIFAPIISPFSVARDNTRKMVGDFFILYMLKLLCRK